MDDTMTCAGCGKAVTIGSREMGWQLWDAQGKRVFCSAACVAERETR